MRLKIAIALLIAAFLIVLPEALVLYTDYLWFSSLGYSDVFLTMLYAKLAFFAVLLAAFLSFAAANLHFAKRRARKPAGWGFAMWAAVIIGIIVSWGFSSWDIILKFLDAAAFGIADPVFGADFSFYVFQLPFYWLLLGFAFVAIVFTAAATIGTYYMSSSISARRKKEHADEEFYFGHVQIPESAKEGMLSHVHALAGIFFLAISALFFLARYELVISPGGIVSGATYTDIVIYIPLLMLLSAISVAASAAMFANVKWKKPLLAKRVLVALAAVMVLGGISGVAVQSVIVAPDEFNVENPYITRNIEATLFSYGLGDVEERDFPVSYEISMQDIEKNRETVSNIRLWDFRPLKNTYKQLQLFRTYYDFYDVDIDRYYLDGEYRQVMLSPRELNVNNLESRAQTWVNRHLVYTHGYGVVMSPASTVTAQGQPDFAINDIPPQSRHIRIDNPRIYFGEDSSTEYSITGTSSQELDYPGGEQNFYTEYSGSDGVRLSGLNRLAFAARFGSIEILVSGSLDSNSRILLNKNIRQRAQELAPFLSYDRDPYMVISDGRLFWILDAYTTSDSMPYSEPALFGQESINYIRNSAKVVMDAYNGDTAFYVIDGDDPLLKTYRNIFPSLFRELSEMPASLKGHLRYPEDLFSLQADVYATYHMREPQVFYNKEDAWEKPEEIFRGSRQEMLPYYIIMKLPEESEEEFIMMLPFTPRGKDNMIGWLAARSDAENYGRLSVFKFSKQELILGPLQVEARIDQDTEISQLFTLWGQSGSDVLRGNLLVIPLENSIIYVEPVFLEATEKGTLPELKRVIAAIGDRLTMQNSVEDALRVLLEEVPQEPGAGDAGSQTAEERLQKALEIYNQAQAALQSGDFSGYAKKIEELGELLG